MRMRKLAKMLFMIRIRIQRRIGIIAKLFFIGIVRWWGVVGGWGVSTILSSPVVEEWHGWRHRVSG